MIGDNSTPTKMLENSIKLNIHTYLVQECGVECRRMEELAFLHEVVCLHLPLALQVDEGGVGLVNGVAVWLLLLSSMCRLLVPSRGWWIFLALAAAPERGHLPQACLMSWAPFRYRMPSASAQHL